MKLGKLLLAIIFAVSLLSGGLMACSDDDSSSGSPSQPPPPSQNPNSFCTQGLCANNSNLEALCRDTFSDCISVDPLNEEECAVVAASTCNVL